MMTTKQPATERVACPSCHRVFPRPASDWTLPPHPVDPDFPNGIKCSAKFGVPV